MQINKLLTLTTLIVSVTQLIIHRDPLRRSYPAGAEANCWDMPTNISDQRPLLCGIWRGNLAERRGWEEHCPHCGAKSYRHPECWNSKKISVLSCVSGIKELGSKQRDRYFEDATVQAVIELTRGAMEK